LSIDPSKSTINYFVKANFTGAYIYFEDRISRLKSPVKKVGPVKKVVGVSGGAVASLIGGTAVGLASIKKTGLVIDTKNGDLLPVTVKKLTELTEDYPDIRKAYNASKRKIADKKEVIRQINLALDAMLK